jgi:hypothetical protein
MFDKLFSKTIPITNQDIIRLSKNHFESKGFTSSLKSLETNIEFYDDTIVLSKNEESLMFTNYITNSPQSDLWGVILKLLENPSFIQDDVTVVKHTTKVLSCIKLYVSSFSEEELLFKSNLKYQSGKKDDRLPVRVFSKIDRIPTDTGHKNVLRIVLIDPLHLVIPSRHGKYDKYQMEERTYKQNSLNKVCMSSCISI